MRPWGEEKERVSEVEQKKQRRVREPEQTNKKSGQLKPQQIQAVCWQAARRLEAECVTSLWQLFVSGRFRANWCKRHSQGLLHESTCSWGVGSTPQTLLGLHSNLFYVGMQTPSTTSKSSVVCGCQHWTLFLKKILCFIQVTKGLHACFWP